MNDDKSENLKPEQDRPSLWETDARSPILSVNRPAGVAPARKPLKHKLVIGAVILGLFFILASAAAYLFFSGSAKPAVIVEFGKIGPILAGEPFSLSVSFSNGSDQVIRNTKLSLILPDEVYFLGEDTGERIKEELIGDVGPGSLNQRTYNLIALGAGETVKHIEARLDYGTNAASRAEFESQSGTDVSIGEPALNLAVVAPQNVFSGESFEVTVNYQNNSNEDMKNINLKIDYPPNFQFGKSEPDPDKGNNVWDGGRLVKGESQSIKIRGTMIGPEKSFFGFAATATGDFLGQTYKLAGQSASVMISSSPLSLNITVNGKDLDYIAHLSDNLDYVLTYKNNTAVTLQNINIAAALSGELFDFREVGTNASLNSITNTFSWVAANTPELASLGPGEEGKVELHIRVKDNFSIRRLSDKNFTLKMSAEIESATVPPGTAASRVVSLAELENKVAGEASIETRGFFRDAASGILNSGPYPPQVNQPTEYTIHWIIKNTATDISNIKVTAFLQSGSVWTGVVKSNVGSAPTYESASGKVTWEISGLPAGKGIVNDPAEAIFQVKATPAVNQIGNDVPLISETKMEAKDSFVNLPITSSDSGITTALPDDQTVVSLDKRVKP